MFFITARVTFAGANVHRSGMDPCPLKLQSLLFSKTQVQLTAEELIGYFTLAEGWHAVYSSAFYLAESRNVAVIPDGTVLSLRCVRKLLTICSTMPPS